MKRFFHASVHGHYASLSKIKQLSALPRMMLTPTIRWIQALRDRISFLPRMALGTITIVSLLFSSMIIPSQAVASSTLTFANGGTAILNEDGSISGICEILEDSFEYKNTDAPSGMINSTASVRMPDGQVVTCECYETYIGDENHGNYAFPCPDSYTFTATPNGDGTYFALIDSDSAEESFSPSVFTPGYPAQRTFVLRWEVYGKISLSKTYNDTTLTQDNAAYSLSGAEYGIYSDKACTTLVDVLVTNSDGEALSSNLAAGTYYVQELVASAGCTLDPTVYTVEVLPGSTAVVGDNGVQEEVVTDVGGISVRKVDAEGNVSDTQDATTATDSSESSKSQNTENSQSVEASKSVAGAQGAASLAGTEYTFLFFAGDFYTVNDAGEVVDELGAVIRTATGDLKGDAPDRTWIVATDETGYASLNSDYLVAEKSDELYYNTSGDVALPLGTLVVFESSAPEGYLCSNNVYYLHIQEVDDASSVAGDITIVDGTRYIGNSAGQQGDYVARGDIELIKVDGQTQKRMANVVFLVTSQSTGESHVIVTDENGQWSSSSSWISHTTNTNANDAAVTTDENGNYVVDESALDPNAGVWFCGYPEESGISTKADNSRGALPYDTYFFQELSSSTNEHKNLVSFTLTIRANNRTISAGTIDDNYLYMATTATDALDGDHLLGVGVGAAIHDSVEYEGLVPGSTYTIRGYLVSQATGEPLLDSDENPISAEACFVAAAHSGEQTLTFELDTTALSGQKIVVFEELYDEEGSLIIEHKNLEDDYQTVEVTTPEIGTILSDISDGDHEALVSTNTTLVDTVHYEGLIPGSTYTMRGVLMDQSSGEVFRLQEEEVATEITFTPYESSGTVGLTFSFDSSKLSNTINVVAFEYLFSNEEEIASHTDLSDMDQTVELTSSPDGVVFDKTGGDSRLFTYCLSGGLLIAVALTCYASIKLRNLHSSSSNK